MSSFTSELIVSPLPDGRRWRLEREFSYHVGSRHSRKIIRVPRGFVTDFASVPEATLVIVAACVLVYLIGLQTVAFVLLSIVAVSSTFKRWGKYGKAAIIHDYCYQKSSTKVNRKEADRIFKEAMCVLDCPAWQVTVMWLYVRVFGWLAWRKKRKARINQK